MPWNQVVWEITDLGDLGLLLPTAALLAGYFLLWGSLRLTCAWLAALAFCGSVTLALKLGYEYWAPSGHASNSTAVYGCAALAWSRSTVSARRTWVVIGAVIVAGLVGVSRVWLQLHSAQQVLLGFGLGLLGIVLFAVLSKGATIRVSPGWWLAAAFGILIVVAHGYRIDSTAHLQRLSGWLSAHDPFRP